MAGMGINTYICDDAKLWALGNISIGDHVWIGHRCYLEGIGVVKDMDKVRLWLELAAAEKGDFWGCAVKASEMLGTIKQ